MLSRWEPQKISVFGKDDTQQSWFSSYSSTVIRDEIVICMIFIKGLLSACHRHVNKRSRVQSSSGAFRPASHLARKQRVSRFFRRAYARPSVSCKVTFL